MVRKRLALLSLLRIATGYQMSLEAGGFAPTDFFCCIFFWSFADFFRDNFGSRKLSPKLDGSI